LLQFIQRYRFAGLVLDANLLLLLVVGRLDRTLIGQAKRVRQFTGEDFDLLINILSRFQRVLVTPHILTEVSNLLTSEQAHIREGARTILCGQMPLLDERFTSAQSLCQLPAFSRLGITDVAIETEGRNYCLVLTTDLDLYLHLESLGVPALNFNHVRTGAWQLPGA